MEYLALHSRCGMIYLTQRRKGAKKKMKRLKPELELYQFLPKDSQ
jgi:hypothetical protein